MNPAGCRGAAPTEVLEWNIANALTHNGREVARLPVVPTVGAIHTAKSEFYFPSECTRRAIQEFNFPPTGLHIVEATIKILLFNVVSTCAANQFAMTIRVIKKGVKNTKIYQQKLEYG